MFKILIITIIIIAVVLILSLVTTSKAYDYKHTVDPLEEDDQNEQIKLERRSEKHGE